MLRFLKKLFQKPAMPGIEPLAIDKHGNRVPQELSNATAALLVEASRCNGEVPEVQIQTVKNILKDQFRFSPEEVSSCLDTVCTSLLHGDNIEEITGAIRENFSVEQRMTLLALMWKVILCDGQLDKRELKTLHGYQFQLGLNDEQFEEARLIAEQNRI